MELGDLKVLVDIATEEWFHELGIDAGIWESLEAASANESIDPEQRFYALDGLVFAEMEIRRHGEDRPNTFRPWRHSLCNTGSVAMRNSWSC